MPLKELIQFLNEPWPGKTNLSAFLISSNLLDSLILIFKSGWYLAASLNEFSTDEIFPE